MSDRTTHLISLIIIVLFAGSTIWWMKHSYDHDLAAEHYTEHIKDYPLLDPALPFYEKEDLIVNVQDLREYMRAIPEQNKDWAEVSIYFEMMNTGANIAVNNDTKILPASLMKLPIGMIAMKRVQDGVWALDSELELTREDVDYITAPEVANEIGKSYSVEFLIERLLISSDNAAYNMLSSQMTDDDLEEAAEAVGLDTIIDQNGKLSAKDYTRLLRSLYSATYLNEEYSYKLLHLLDKSEFSEFVTAKIPANVPISHKWGANLEHNVYSDSGIVYVEGRPYMFSVMIQGKGKNTEELNQKAKRLMQDIGERTYNFVKEQ